MSRLFRPVLLACAVCVLRAAPPDVSLPTVQAALAKLPLRFEANQGQADASIRYTARARGYTLFLTAQGASLGFEGSRRIDLSLPGSRPPKFEPLDRFTARTDYMVGAREKWRTNIASYARVAYRDVYPGVDVIYYGRDNELEFDFVLNPGADPAAIRMKFGGAKKVSLSPEGDLLIEAGRSRLVQKRPSIFQDGHPVEGRYTMLADGMVGVHVEDYDTARALVIDPVISYVTYMGSTGVDTIRAAKLGPNGLLYITGATDTQEMPATLESYTNITAGLTDIFLAIIDTNPPPVGSGRRFFEIKYFSYFGGAALDVPKAIDVDKDGVLYITGTTTSTNFPIAAAFQSTGAASTVDAFVTKLDPISKYGTDSLLFSSYLGGADGDDSGNGIAVGPDGMIYVIGNTKATNFPITSDWVQEHRYGTQDIFVSKVDPNNAALAYSTYLGGETLDDGRAIVVGSDGLVYFSATTLGQQFPMAGFSFNGVFIGSQAAVVGVMDMTKGSNSLVYATFLGGAGGDGRATQEARGLTVDANNNIVVTGYTMAGDFPVTQNALQVQNRGNADAFLTIINPRIPFAGGLIYSTLLGGRAGDVGYDVKMDAEGFVYVTGYTLSPDFPVGGDAPQKTWGGGTDIFLTKFKPGASGDAALPYSTYIGPSGTYVPSNVAVRQDGTVLLVGSGTPGLPSSPQATQTGHNGGGQDGFLLVLGQTVVGQ